MDVIMHDFLILENSENLRTVLDRSRDVGLKFYLGVFFSDRLRTHVQHNLRLETEVSLFRGLNFSSTSLLLSSTVLNFWSASVV